MTGRLTGDEQQAHRCETAVGGEQREPWVWRRAGIARSGLQAAAPPGPRVRRQLGPRPTQVCPSKPTSPLWHRLIGAGAKPRLRRAPTRRWRHASSPTRQTRLRSTSRPRRRSGRRRCFLSPVLDEQAVVVEQRHRLCDRCFRCFAEDLDDLSQRVRAVEERDQCWEERLDGASGELDDVSRVLEQQSLASSTTRPPMGRARASTGSPPRATSLVPPSCSPADLGTAAAEDEVAAAATAAPARVGVPVESPSVALGGRLEVEQLLGQLGERLPFLLPVVSYVNKLTRYATEARPTRHFRVGCVSIRPHGRR